MKNDRHDAHRLTIQIIYGLVGIAIIAAIAFVPAVLVWVGENRWFTVPFLMIYPALAILVYPSLRSENPGDLD